MSELEHEGWEDRLVRERAWVMHVPTGTVGRVVERQVSLPDEFVILKFEEGHGFHAKREADFRPLNERDAAFYGVCVQLVAKFVFELAHVAASSGIEERAFHLLVVSALRSQLRAIGRAWEQA